MKTKLMRGTGKQTALKFLAGLAASVLLAVNAFLPALPVLAEESETPASSEVVTAKPTADGANAASAAAPLTQDPEDLADGTPKPRTGEGTPIDESTFPDAAFRAYVEKYFDADGDGSLSQEEIDAVIEIGDSPSYLPENVSSLKGIEIFSSLEKLICDECPLNSLDVSKNKELKELCCAYTQISTLDLTKNTKLEQVLCGYNPLSSLDLSGNPELRFFNIDSTNISHIDVTANRKLIGLEALNTPMTGLDLSSCDRLEVLSLSFSSTEDIYNSAFAWINIDGPNTDRLVAYIPYSVLDLGKIGESLNLKEQFPGIDPTKIKDLKGAVLDAETGILSGYQNGTPITYTYDCGTASSVTFPDGSCTTGQVDMPVTLNFTYSPTTQQPENPGGTGTEEIPGGNDPQKPADTQTRPVIHTTDSGATKPEASQSKETDSVKTGDPTGLGLWISLVCVSGAAAVGIAVKRCRNRLGDRVRR